MATEASGQWAAPGRTGARSVVKSLKGAITTAHTSSASTQRPCHCEPISRGLPRWGDDVWPRFQVEAADRRAGVVQVVHKLVGVEDGTAGGWRQALRVGEVAAGLVDEGGDAGGAVLVGAGRADGGGERTQALRVGAAESPQESLPLVAAQPRHSRVDEQGATPSLEV